MMQTNKEAFQEFVKAFGFTSVVMVLFMLSMLFLINLGNQKPPQKGVESPRFEVVDKYKGCDVVRWEQKGLAEYKYFLHCGR
jgi:competence protein ComGC